MPNPPSNPKSPSSNPNQIDPTRKAPGKEGDDGGREPVRRDRGPGVEQEHERERELEDQVGRTSDEPDMVPPGQQPVRRGGQPGDIEHDRGRGTDDEAMQADRATQRSSDRMDGRDGVDSSDTIGNDPDAGGKPRRGRSR